MKTEKGRIVDHGAGWFLNPPGHPEHTKSVETDLWRRPENRGFMSLSGAVDAEYLDDATRAEAKALLDAWQANRMPLESPEVQEWVLQVLGYFHECYRNPDVPAAEQWNAGKVLIRPTWLPLEHVNSHAGVRHIRKYYPEFAPTADHFARAYWGQKPETKP